MQDILLNLLFTGIGITMLCYGGNWLVNGGVVIAKRFGVSNMLIGMTVVAYGTSTPELATSIAAAGEHGEIILGNVIGSNIANVGMVIGIAAIIIPLVVEKTTIRKEIPIMLAASVLIVVLSFDGEISQFDGVILVSLLIVFTIYAYKDIKKQQQDIMESKERKEKTTLSKSVLLIGIGIVLLYFGAKFTVENAVIIAQFLNVPERIIGITVIAIGTSLPELITSIVAIKKGHTDIGVGNIIGSNIYNILMIMGVASTIAGIAIASEVFYDYIIMIAFSLSLLLAIRSRYVGRKIGIGLVIAYVVYLIASFMFI
ncbi:MAG: calcium/sodium antiporter [Nitrosopumilaceae archaeon]|nr:calcium/sodium antiporter [Nitrosopumilaceae archaeon]NIU01583.1 calcium/sodium antiporter [Nitrosopumilaceae archaeon]NIU88002.1 calcium/sodium antiporter [Nitrosopumilaceae archaeon]NIV66269.1 calcium/sodium antiporter [Nitrosopumilaceae archaeon]NIX62185.1 calcium/sodium antiporter [Nitrosopumilaceae archaeon]